MNQYTDKNIIEAFNKAMDETYPRPMFQTQTQTENIRKFNKELSELSEVSPKNEFTQETYDFNSFYKDCKVFNEVAGNHELLTPRDFRNQQGYLDEEVKEIRDGIDANNIAEILDGVVDTFVVNNGHIQRLEKLGIPVAKALELIAKNNLSKYIKFDDTETLTKTLKMYADKGEHVYPELNIKYNLFVVKRSSDNKIMKPYNFTPVDLSNIIPQELKEKGLTQ